MTDAYCATLSLEIEEPLAGTAVSDTDRWLLLEHDGPWGPRGVEDSQLSGAVVELLSALSVAHPRLRVQLVRRPGEESRAGVRLFLAQTGEGASRVAQLELAHSEALAELPLTAWLAGGELPGELVREPLYFVCVHGKRDRCCARLGMPVFTALDREVGARVFQTTHLGGHRFAATLLELPSGLCYGRVVASEAAALVAASERGEIYDLARLRGRTAYPSAAQAAEIALRSALGEPRSDALTLRAVSCVEGGDEVRFVERASGREHALFVERASLPPAPASCGAAPKPASKLLARLTTNAAH